MASWEIAGRLPDMHKVEALWFRDQVGLALGHFTSLDDLLNLGVEEGSVAMESVVLRTENSGMSWEKVYSGRGKITAVSQRDERQLYALGREFGRDRRWRTYLIRSNDQGSTWHELPGTPTGIIGMDFTAESLGYVWSETRISETPDHTTTWKPLDVDVSLTRDGPQVVVDPLGNLWIPTRFEVLHFDRIGLSEHIPLPDEVTIVQLAVGRKRSLWLLGRGRENRSIVLLRRDTPGGFEVVAEIPGLRPNSFFVGRKTISITAIDVSQSVPSYVVLMSSDGGKSWQRETPIISHAMGAVFYEADGRIWAYGSADRIQRRLP